MKLKFDKANLSPEHPENNYIDREPAQRSDLPMGPFRLENGERAGSLLLFAPRNAIGAVIDRMTGGYGYSHLAIDCGEVDAPSGKRVMIEATPALGVHNAFQDQYGERKFARIPLRKTGIDVDRFCDCIRSKLGEKYSDEEILTLGLVENPAKQICSDLATVCLPKDMLVSMAHYYQTGFPYRLSPVLIYGMLDKNFHLFISPNGFAQYFGVPMGKHLDGSDQLSEPVIPNQRMSTGRKSNFWGIGMAVLCGLALLWLFKERPFRVTRDNA